MEITIEGEEENTLLNRKEIQFSIVHDGETPSRLAVRDSIAAKLDKASDEVIVHEMNTRFGMNETLGYAKVYEGSEDAKEIEEAYMLQRNKVATDGEDGEGEADAATEEAADEADVDEADEASDEEETGEAEGDEEGPEEDEEGGDEVDADEDADDEEVEA
jgi:small subunit ribosomal protein S24e